MTLAPFTSAPFTYPGGPLAVGLSVRVYHADTSVLAPIYYTSSGTRRGNPTRTQDDGTVSFYVEPGDYDLFANGVRTPVTVGAGGNVDPIVDKGTTLAFSVDSGSGAGTGKSRIYNDTGLTVGLRRVRATVETLSGATLIADVKKNGSSVFTSNATRPTVAAPGGTSAAIPDVTTVMPGDYFTVDVLSAGNYQNLVVQIHLR